MLDGRRFAVRVGAIMKRRCQTISPQPFRRLALALAVLFYFSATPLYAGLLTGKPAPGFDLVDHTGAACRLDGFAGQPLLLKIGTTWCPSCGGQSDELVKALPELRKLEVAVVEVFVEDGADAVREYRDQHQLPDAIRTCLDRDGQVLGGYSVVSIPRVLMLDAEHRVVKDQYLVPARGIVETFRGLSH